MNQKAICSKKQVNKDVMITNDFNDTCERWARIIRMCLAPDQPQPSSLSQSSVQPPMKSSLIDTDDEEPSIAPINEPAEFEKVKPGALVEEEKPKEEEEKPKPATQAVRMWAPMTNEKADLAFTYTTTTVAFTVPSQTLPRHLRHYKRHFIDAFARAFDKMEEEYDLADAHIPPSKRQRTE